MSNFTLAIFKGIIMSVNLAVTNLNVYTTWCSYANLDYDGFIDVGDQWSNREYPACIPDYIKESPLHLGTWNVSKRLIAKTDYANLKSVDEVSLVCCLIIKHLIYSKKPTVTDNRQLSVISDFLTNPRNIDDLVKDNNLPDELHYRVLIDSFYSLIYSVVNYLLASRAYIRLTKPTQMLGST